MVALREALSPNHLKDVEDEARLGACRMPRCKECARALWPHACPLLLPCLNSKLTAAAHIGVSFACKMLRQSLLVDSARGLPPAK